ncbi:carboxypeptidase-like regulatory domain-containing protein, partial [Bradyrhizobium sp. NBAIM08]|uniref:carboxypeptidase-like regulatory domain-containing protein n=1 Tax=Bradyrhizobium sp. NBAIM08 TaxID=2793815 RepID=UPI001CD322F9
FAQVTVSGTVTDAATHQPLKSVSILFKGSRRGTTSDADGKFTLSATGNFTQILFSYIGYKSAAIDVVAGTQTIDVALVAGADTTNVLVKPHKVKYRNKDNPAVELIQKVIENKEKNGIGSYDYAQYEQYEKMQVAISNLAEKLKNSKLLRKYRFVLDEKDTSKLMEGRSVVPVYLQETISQNYYR